MPVHQRLGPPGQVEEFLFPAGLREGPSPSDFAALFARAMDPLPRQRRPARLAVEPGRAVVARAGWVVARVLHVRDRGEAWANGSGRQVVLDAGMTELVRPALYGAEHPMFALTSEANLNSIM